MNNPGLIKNLIAAAVIAAYRIVKFGADDAHVAQGAAATDALIGVTGQLGAAAAEDRIDITLSGTVYVEYGGAVTRGDPLTSDAVGRAVTAAPAAGVNNRTIGFAMSSGVLGDIGSVDISKNQIQG